MRNLLTITLLGLAMLCSGRGLFAELQELNRFWAGNETAVPAQLQRVAAGETGLIQTHLLLVEKQLRAHTPPGLTSSQLRNRARCLDALAGYRKKGAFPKNLYFAVRTPFFIDEDGTPCAVGQLIIASGHRPFAEKISRERNNGYIFELAAMYPQLAEWARANGFLLSELAWIQPCYCGTMPGTVNVICNGTYSGYFYPDVSHLPQPCTDYNFYKLVNGDWVPLQSMYCHTHCNLSGGKYKWTLRDGSQKIHELVCEIKERPPLVNEVRIVPATAGCNGSATVTVSGLNPPYSFEWYPSVPGASNVATSLCDSTYYVHVKDGEDCGQFVEIRKDNPAGIAGINAVAGISAGPNPTSGEIRVSGTGLASTRILVLDLAGKERIGILRAEGDEAVIDVSALEPGIYVLSVQTANGWVHRKVIREQVPR